MMGDHAIYHDGWIASTKVMRPPWVVIGRAQGPVLSYPWELYDLSEGLDAVRERRRQEPGKAEGDAGAVLEGGEEVPGAAARRVGG